MFARCIVVSTPQVRCDTAQNQAGRPSSNQYQLHASRVYATPSSAPLSPPLSTITQETSHQTRRRLSCHLEAEVFRPVSWTCARLAYTREGPRPYYRWSGLPCLGRGAYVLQSLRSRGHRVTLLRSFPTRRFSLPLGLGRPVVMVWKAGVGAAPTPQTDDDRSYIIDLSSCEPAWIVPVPALRGCRCATTRGQPGDG